MARDDYFLMVYRILSYLYKCIKECKKPSEEYLKPLTKDFPIEYGYWAYIIENIVNEGFVENVGIVQIELNDPPEIVHRSTKEDVDAVEQQAHAM